MVFPVGMYSSADGKEHLVSASCLSKEKKSIHTHLIELNASKLLLYKIVLE